MNDDIMRLKVVIATKVLSVILKGKSFTTTSSNEHMGKASPSMVYPSGGRYGPPGTWNSIPPLY